MRVFIFCILLISVANASADPFLSQQWGFNDHSIGWSAAKDIVRESFPEGYIPDASSPVAAIIDLGFTYHEDLDRHSFLHNNTIYIADCNDKNVRCDVYEDITNICVNKGNCGHGNSSIGIMGAMVDNSKGIASSGFGVIKVLAIDAHYVDPSGTHINGMEGASIIRATDFIIAEKSKGVNIVAVNMSFRSPSNELYESVKKLGDNGILVVAAAGYGGQNNPASFDLPNIISVAAIDAAYNMDVHTGVVHIAAPTGMMSFGISNDYTYSGGSSAAAPFITGLLTAGAAVRQGIAPSKLIEILYNTSNSLPNGNKYVNAAAFMTEVAQADVTSLPSVDSGSSGGCSLAPDGKADPGLLLLGMLLFAVVRRRRLLC